MLVLMCASTVEKLSSKVIFRRFCSVIKDLCSIGVRRRQVHIRIDFSLFGSQENYLCMYAYELTFGVEVKLNLNSGKMCILKPLDTL